METGGAENRRNLCGRGPMIFVTVGTQLPFPRLVDFMARWASVKTERVVFQTGQAHGLVGFEAHGDLPIRRFEQTVDDARIIVSHAGIGTVLAAQFAGKPIIIVPRRAALAEHRNNHQCATAQALKGRAGLRVAWEVEDLPPLLASACEGPQHGTNPRCDSLVDRVRSFVSA